jgi:hypothetical protein
VNLGYEPQWILCKSISAGQNWILGDVMRGWNANSTTNMQIGLRANTTAAENATLNTFAQVTATGFNATINNASDTYIYIAIRRGPMKVPTLGTSVFSPILQSNANTPPRTISGAGFAPDLLFQGTYQYANGTYLYDRLRGQFTLQTCYDNPESSAAAAGASFTMDGITYTGAGSINNNGNAVDWFFKRAPSFFDEVCYTGTGASLTLSHNLTVSPELIIAKKRNGAGQWPVFAAPLVNKYLYLDGSNAASTDSGTFWLGVTPTTFSVADNLSYGTNVAYLFATCAGVSKVGSYTGNGSTQTINCGFGAGGARFVLIKRTDATGDWYVYDTARGMTTLTDPYLLLNLASTGAATLGSVTTVSTGFALNSTILAAINVNAGTYIFFAVS